MASLSGVVLLGVLPTFQPTAPRPAHLSTTLAASSPWLDRFNQWRATAGVPSVTENTTWSSGDYLHAQYMVKTGQVTHYETAGPYYTTAGDTAAQNSNIFVSSSTGTSDGQAIDWWMGAPFHAMAMMDPRLTQTGFGSYRDTTAAPWQMGAAVDVSRGNSYTGGTFPVFWPGNGVTEPLTAYSGNETPDPTSACPGYAGLPVFVEVGGNVSTTAGPVHSFTANGAPLDHCVIDSTNASLSTYLKARGGVIVMPRVPLLTGVRYTVSLTVNGAPYSWSFTVGPFSISITPPLPGWTSLNGVLTSGPDASSWGAARVDVFARGTNNGIWHKWWDGTQWSSWEDLGRILTSNPGAVSWGANRIDLFARGTDNALYHRWWDGANWYGWESLGGNLSSGPDVSSWGFGRLDIFARGTNNALVHKWWDGRQWSSWEDLGGILTTDPSAVSWGPNRIDVFALSTNNGLWHKWWDGSRWNGWESLGGALSSAPDVASCSANHLDVVAMGTDHGFWRKSWNGTQWSAWSSLGGQWTSDPSAVCEPGTSNLDIFDRSADNAIWTKSLPGS